jgi:hypothetical protein
MFDDIFSVINDWFPSNQELSFDDLNQNYSDNSNDLVNWDYDNSIITDHVDFNQENVDNFIDSDVNLSNDFSENLVTDYDQNFDNSSLIAETEISNNFVNSSNYYIYEENWDLSKFDGVGNPFGDADCWQQQDGQNSCAVVAQMGVYESITGVELSEEEVSKFAEANGLFDPEMGTFPDDVGKILNAFGLTTESHFDANLSDIAEALEKGDKVIVGLDANETWQPLRDANGNPIEQEDGGHAVWVTGIDQLPDGSVKLILNDSGIPDGQMKVVDGVDFINAWDDFGNQIVIAHNSPSSALV